MTATPLGRILAASALAGAVTGLLAASAAGALVIGAGLAADRLRRR